MNLQRALLSIRVRATGIDTLPPDTYVYEQERRNAGFNIPMSTFGSHLMAVRVRATGIDTLPPNTYVYEQARRNAGFNILMSTFGSHLMTAHA